MQAPKLPEEDTSNGLELGGWADVLEWSNGVISWVEWTRDNNNYGNT